MELRRRCRDILHCPSGRDRFKSPLHRKQGTPMKTWNIRWLVTLASLVVALGANGAAQA
jgi:hypothetical protein